MPSTEASALNSEQLSELLELIKDADSVELKLTVPDVDRRSAVAALQIEPLEAQIRQLVSFDRADLALNQRKLVVRARRTQASGDDSVEKRPMSDRHSRPLTAACADGG